MTTDADQWRLKEIVRWEGLWQGCKEFISALNVKELRGIIAEYLIKLSSNDWSTNILLTNLFGLFMKCESSNSQWEFHSDNWKLAKPRLKNTDMYEALVGQHPCSATVSHILIAIYPPETACYQIGFWNSQNGNCWTIFQQSLEPFVSFGAVNSFGATDSFSTLQLRHVGYPPHCISINIVNSKMYLTAYFSNNDTQQTSVAFPTESEDHLHLFVLCCGIQVPTYFHLDYHGCN